MQLRTMRTRRQHGPSSTVGVTVAPLRAGLPAIAGQLAREWLT